MNKVLGCGLILFGIFVLTLQDVPPAAGEVPEEIREGFRETALRYHNFYRQQKGLTPLELNNELNVLAHRHAERLAEDEQLKASGIGYDENLWAHRGPLRSLSLSSRDAVNNWYTGSKVPGNIFSLVDTPVLYSDKVKYLGIGVGTKDLPGTGKDYTVVVANYAQQLYSKQ